LAEGCRVSLNQLSFTAPHPGLRQVSVAPSRYIIFYILKLEDKMHERSHLHAHFRFIIQPQLSKPGRPSLKLLLLPCHSPSFSYLPYSGSIKPKFNQEWNRTPSKSLYMGSSFKGDNSAALQYTAKFDSSTPVLSICGLPGPRAMERK